MEVYQVNEYLFHLYASNMFTILLVINFSALHTIAHFQDGKKFV